MGKYSNLQSVSLYGHSLGARVLIEALLHNQGDTGLKIGNLALMGGARALQQQELEHILPQVQGGVFITFIPRQTRYCWLNQV